MRSITFPQLVSFASVRLHRAGLWYCFRLLPSLVAAGLFILLLSASPARSSAPDFGELSSGQMILSPAGGGSSPALLHDSHIDLRVSGMVAVVTLTQSFENTTGQWAEGIYAFPLPEEAAVRSLTMQVGERLIVGRIREREQALAEFEAARKAGKKASLVEQQRPNLFTNRVANLAPDERIAVTLEYVQPVSYRDGVFSLRLPTTITARYMPGAALADDEASLVSDPTIGWARATTEVPDAPRISPFQHPVQGSDNQPLNPLSLAAEIDMGMPLAELHSHYHTISVKREGAVYKIALAGSQVEMNRDLVLQWAPVAGSEPQAAFFAEQVGDAHYGLLMLVPPVASPVSIPRELVFVVDTSGSMGGVSIEQARASVSRALRQLRPDDYFNVIEFNSHHRSLFAAPVPATRHNVGRASEFVRLLNASGGTEMLPALRQALSGQEELHAGRLRQVVFITDGAVGNEVALFEEIAASLGHARLFTVGIGSAPNGWFMRKAADFGRGTHTVIGDLSEVAPRMDALFEALAAPVATDIRANWPAAADSWPERVPDLYRGEPLLLAVAFPNGAPAGEVTVVGTLGGQRWERQISIDASDGADHPGIATLWARRKITALLDDKVLGRSEDAVRADVLEVALAHQLLSPYTSFVAIEEVVSRPPEAGMAAHQVPNTPPRGQSPQHYAWPATATDAPLKIYLGSLCLFIALLIRVLRQPEVDRVQTVAV